MSRRIRIAGNWKMNKTPRETTEFLQELLPKLGSFSCTVAVCPPFTALSAAVEAVAGTAVMVGAQNCHGQGSGAFTGEVSPQMLSDMGVGLVLLGHSERRTLFGDTDATVNARCKGALESGMEIILCVGESLQQREQGETGAHLKNQLTMGLSGISAELMHGVSIAYEPIWAIGTGKTATSLQAQEACLWVRQTIAALYGAEIAQEMPILYGGSMNENNAEELLEQPDIDGGLIGGAALKSDVFAAIVAQADCVISKKA